LLTKPSIQSMEDERGLLFYITALRYLLVITSQINGMFFLPLSSGWYRRFL